MHSGASAEGFSRSPSATRAGSVGGDDASAELAAVLGGRSFVSGVVCTWVVDPPSDPREVGASTGICRCAATRRRRRCYRRGMRPFIAIAIVVGVCDLLRAAATTQPIFVEHVHSSIVPHTDRVGHVLEKFDAGGSFFPIGLWGQALPDAEGGPYPDWKEIAAAGFNTIWPMNWNDRAIGLAQEAKIQLVF